MKALPCKLALCLTLGPVFAETIALGHARLKDSGVLKPRSNADGLKTAPCGGVPPTSPVQLSPGQIVKIPFEETINHPGWYEIHLSTNSGSTFDHTLLERLDDVQNDRATLPHSYETVVTIPNVQCKGGCVIQLIQVMTDRTPPTKYFSCADVQIVQEAQTAPTQSPATASSPLPQPVPQDSQAQLEPPRNFRIRFKGAEK